MALVKAGDAWHFRRFPDEALMRGAAAGHDSDSELLEQRDI